jgi:signal transduction histidine kinase
VSSHRGRLLRCSIRGARGAVAAAVYSRRSSRRVSSGRTTAGGRPRTLVRVSSFDQLVRSASLRIERMPADATLAVTVAVIQVASTASFAHAQDGRQALDVLGIALLVGAPAALYWLRRMTVPVLAFTLVVTLAYWSLDYPRGPAFIALTVAFAVALLRGHRGAAWLSAGLAWAGLLWLPALVGDAATAPLGKAVGVGAWMLVFGAAMELIAFRRDRTQEAERARRQEEIARAGQERLRIARELHDVLAHNVSLINVQAGTALHLLDQQPERARPALEAIKDASSETLREVRSVLGILRGPGEEAPRSPTAGTAGVEELISRTAAAGISVASEVRGDPRPLPASVDLAVYRILQEALTNVARHAQPAVATVRLTFADDDVTLEVEDDGAGNGEVPPAGNGIAGMRERVAALGGDFSAGPRGDSGFRVAARLPLGGGA